MDSAVAELISLLVCTRDREPLDLRGQALVCVCCSRSYPMDSDGIVSFLSIADAGAAGWDEESEAYVAAFGEYTDAVEVGATVGRLGSPAGPVLDHGAGSGRMTSALRRATGQPVIAVDYSRENLRRLVTSCRGQPVLAVHADVRQLPLRDGAVGGACSAGVHPLLRAPDRRRMLEELARVLPPGAPLVLSTLNYSWVFRAWRLRGNRGAREGEHLHGRQIYYQRLTRRELCAELTERFAVEEVVGVRNLPARSLASALRRIAGARLGGFLGAWLERHGPRLDRALERLPSSPLTGFMLLARTTRRPGR